MLELRPDRDYELETKNAIQALLNSNKLMKQKLTQTPTAMSQNRYMEEFGVIRFNNGRQTGKTKNTLEIITNDFRRPLFATIKSNSIKDCIRCMQKHSIRRDNIEFVTYAQLESYFIGTVPGNLGPKDHDIIVLDIYGYRNKNNDVLKMLCTHPGVNPYATILCIG